MSVHYHRLAMIELSSVDQSPTVAEANRQLRVRIASLCWVVPALLTSGLGLWRLTSPALWADELATWGAVRLPWDQLWRLSGSVDEVLTPYYAAMKVYVAVFGTSTAALRLPALIAMTGTTLTVTALGRRLGGTRTGVLAGLFFAVLPVSSRFAQEARSYAIAMFAAALAVLCLLRLVERPTMQRAGLYLAAVLLASLSHPLSAVLMLAGHGFAVGLWCISGGRGADGRRDVRWWLAGAVVGGLPAVVLIALGYRSRAQISWIKPVTLAIFQVAPDRLFFSGAVGGIVLALAVLAIGRSWEQICLAAAGFVPPAALLVLGIFVPVWAARYAMVGIAPLAVLAAVAVVRFGSAQAIAVLVLTAVFGYPAQLDIRGSAGHSEDSAKIARVIRPLYRAGDVAVFPDTNPSIAWAPRDIYSRYLPAPRPPDVLSTAPQRTDGKLLATECPAAACLGDPPRIWLIRVDNASDPFQDMDSAKQQVLRAHYRTVRRWSYPLLGITLLERMPL